MRVIIVNILLLITLAGFGQIVPFSGQYILNPILINPACAGMNDALNLAGFYRNQWVGIEGAPKKVALFADGPFLNDKVGLGLNISNEHYGISNEFGIGGNYSYRIAFGMSKLSFGLGANVTVLSSRLSDLSVIDNGDEVYLSDEKKLLIPNFSLGLYYRLKGYFLGFSVPQILSYQYITSSDEFDLKNDFSKYTWLLNTGYSLDINKRLKLTPSVLLRIGNSNALQYDANLMLGILDRFYFGASYMPGRAIGGIMQFRINQQLSFGYNYDVSIGDLNGFSNSSHDILLRYTFLYKVNVPSPVNF